MSKPSLVEQPIQGGPTQPAFLMNGQIDSSVACGTKAAAGLNTLIAAPAAGSRIVVYSFIIQNESATATTVELRDVTSRWRMLLQNQGDKMIMGFDTILPWRLNEATALSLWLSGANSHGYSIQYAIEKV